MRTSWSLELRRCVLVTLLGTTFCAVGYGAVDCNAAEKSTETTQPPTYSPRDTLRGTVVDEQGQPVAGARVCELWMSVIKKDVGVVSDRDGRFKLGVVPGHWQQYANLLARTPDGTRQGWKPVHETHSVPLPTEIVIKPARRVAVSVVDASGDPVAGATVDVMASYSTIALGTTDANGKVELLIPADAPVDWVLGLKSGVGFDYYENYEAFPSSDRGPLPETIRLVLDGARPEVVVTAHSSDDARIKGVMITPWTIEKPGKLGYANIGAALSARQFTDAEGETHFDWFPKAMIHGVTFLTRYDGYRNAERYTIDESSWKNALTITMNRNGTIHGKVTLPGGAPASQILLQAEGNGSPDYFRGLARTDEEGNYSFSVYTGQEYAIQVVDDEWAAAAHVGESIQQGDPPHEVNFTLLRGTMVQGTLTIGADNAPAVGATATLTQSRAAAAQGGKVPQFVRWATADSEGHYRFRIGPGEYELSLPDGMLKERKLIDVTDKVSIVVDGHAARRERGTLSGKLLRADDGAALPGALVWGETSTQPHHHAGFHTVADATGHFSTERWNDEMLLVARDLISGCAGFTEIGPDDKECDLKLSPGAAVNGRVIDDAGKPMRNARIQCTVNVPLKQPRDEKQSKTGGVHFFLLLDNDGKFSVPAVPLGSQLFIYVDSHKQAELEISEAKEIAAADIVMKAAPVEEKND